MRFVLPLLLFACGKSQLPNGQEASLKFELVDDWKGLPTGRSMNASTPVGNLDQALREAQSRGLVLGDKEVDISGEWTGLAMGGTSLNEERILRRRSAKGVYDTINRLYLYDKAGKALIRAESFGTDVIGSNQYCSFISRMEVSFADKETEQSITNIHLLLNPDSMNEDGCHDLTEVSRSKLVFVNGAGDTMIQTSR